MSNIVVTQPLHQPADYVAYGTTPNSCYGQPRFLSEYSGTGYDDLLIVGYTDGDFCGKQISYTACESGSLLTVVYDFAASPHDYIKYGEACYSYAGTTSGSESFVLAAEVTPVPSCSDIACTPVDPSGPSLVYFTADGLEAGVFFDHLDTGTAHYGVTPRVVDDGLNGLSAGRVRFRLTQPRMALTTVEGTGTLIFRLERMGFFKRLIQVRSGSETTYKLTAGETTAVVQVEPGDAFYLDASTLTGRLSTFASNAVVEVSWVPYVYQPRHYDTGTLSASGTLLALGFCGLTTHQTYTFFGTLPVDASTTDLVNPDTTVSVQGGGSPEYLLLRNRSAGQADPTTPALPWYGGEGLSAPILFRFYSGREDRGAHGEMDVWLDTDGTFPGTLSVDPYRALVLDGNSYRKVQEAGDIPRGTLEVASSGSFSLPNQYRGTDGQLLTFANSDSTVVYNAGTYTLIGSDPGLSFNIL